MGNIFATNMTLRRRFILWLIGVVVVIVFAIATESDSLLLQFDAPLRSPAVTSPVDQSIYMMARDLARLAATPQEQHLAAMATRAADHELDQSFVSAIRSSTRHTSSSSPALARGLKRVAELRTAIQKDHATVSSYQNEKASDLDAKNQRLRLAEAQLALDNDELDNAQQDLARLDENKAAEIQQAFDQHQSSKDQAAALPRETETAALETLDALQSLRGKLNVRSLLTDREQLIGNAKTKIAEELTALTLEHYKLERSGTAGIASQAETNQAQLDRINALAERQKDMSDLDRRIRDLGQLQGIYGDWQKLLKQQLRAVNTAIAHNILAFTMALLGAFVLSGAIRSLFRSWERKYHQRLDNARLLVLVILQALVAFRLFTIIFGVPSDVSTLLGLVTAGITIALRDFVMSFVGWILLMGKSGIRVGDWVEINGTQGEVAQITRLHTFVLETGNWTTDGHPTGRQAIFLNKFVIEGKYFNFSTPGQWLWDQLSIPIPVGTQMTSEMLARMQEAVEMETREDTRRAEESWRELVRSHGLLEFAPTPTVSLRTSAAGLEVTIRYVARAERRFGKSVILRQAVLGTLGLINDGTLKSQLIKT